MRNRNTETPRKNYEESATTAVRGTIEGITRATVKRVGQVATHTQRSNATQANPDMLQQALDNMDFGDLADATEHVTNHLKETTTFAMSEHDPRLIENVNKGLRGTDNAYRRGFGGISRLDSAVDTAINNIGERLSTTTFGKAISPRIEKINASYFRGRASFTNAINKYNPLVKQIPFVNKVTGKSGILTLAKGKYARGFSRFCRSEGAGVALKFAGRAAFVLQCYEGAKATYNEIQKNGGLVNKNGTINKQGAKAGIREGSKQIGGIAGAWLGGKVGAAIGSAFFPPVGTIVGGLVGAGAGYIIGSGAGKVVGNAIVKYGKSVLKTTMKIALAPTKVAIAAGKAIGKGVVKLAKGAKQIAGKVAAKISKTKVGKTIVKTAKTVAKIATAPIKGAVKAAKTIAKTAVKGVNAVAKTVANSGKVGKAVVNGAKTAAKKVLGWLGF